LANMLSHYVDLNHSNWSRYVKAVTYAYNASTNDATKATPCELFLNRLPILPPDVNLLPSRRLSDVVVTNIEELRTLAIENSEKRFKANKERYDGLHKPATFKVGDLVLVDDHTFSRNHRDKFAPRFLGPHKVTKV